MELRPLRYFCAVAHNQSFTRSARELHVSQSAISEQIAHLEEEIGVPLLVRDGHKTQLTPHGEIFLAEATKVLAGAARAVEMAQRSLRGEIGTLRIGFFNGGTGPLFTRLIREFRSRHPGVHLSLAEMIPPLQSKALVEGAIDIGFTRPLERPFDQHLETELVALDPLMVVVPKHHRLAPGPVEPRALATERFVLVARETSSALFDRIIAMCSRAGFSPEIVGTASVWSSVALLVQAGEGISILPGTIRHAAPGDLVFCPLKGSAAAIELLVAWSPARENAIRTSFLELLRALRDKTRG